VQSIRAAIAVTLHYRVPVQRQGFDKLVRSIYTLRYLRERTIIIAGNAYEMYPSATNNCCTQQSYRLALRVLFLAQLGLQKLSQPQNYRRMRDQ